MIINKFRLKIFKYILLNLMLCGIFFTKNISAFFDDEMPLLSMPIVIDNIDYAKNNNINNKNSASICRYCLCDLPSVSVICNSRRKMRLKVISLPNWAEIFHAQNLTLKSLPHFSYHSKLRILRINYCELRELHPLALLPLPALEIIDFRNNKISTLPENFFERLKRLKVINLAHNHIQDLNLMEWRLSNNQIIDELHLSGNTLCQGANNDYKFSFPKTRRLYLINSNIKSINSTHITFKNSTNCKNIRTLSKTTKNLINSFSIKSEMWKELDVLDLSDNINLQVLPNILTVISNLKSLYLRRAILPRQILNWLKVKTTRIRRLDLNGAKIAYYKDTFNFLPYTKKLLHLNFPDLIDEFDDSNSNFYFTINMDLHWNNYCNSELEWLDISNMNLEHLEIDSNCGIKWLYAENNHLISVKLHHIKFGGVMPLKTLRLDNNRLRSWPLVLTSEEINIAHDLNQKNFNYVPQVDSNAFLALEILSLANNSLNGVLPHNALKELRALVHLDLSNNKLERIYNYENLSPVVFGSYEIDNNHTVNINLNNTIFDLNTINSHLEYLNVSGNALDDVAGPNWPRLMSLAVFDASSNALVNVDVLEIFRKMPLLQHLHLAHNSHIGQQTLPLMLPDKKLILKISEKIGLLATNLVEINLEDCALRNLPDFSSFSRLSSINLKNNLLSEFDGDYVPYCIYELDLSENRIIKVENFSGEQINCIKQLNLARNSLQCNCEIQTYLPILQQQDTYYDRTEYYCFSADGWQHPLSAYIDSNTEECREQKLNYNLSDSKKNDKTFNIILNVIKLISFIILILFIMIISIILLMKFYHFVTSMKILTTISYKLIPNNEPPVQL